jgi:hypothetical protein
MSWLLGVKNAENFWGEGLARLSIRPHSLHFKHLDLTDIYDWDMSFINWNNEMIFFI